MNVVSLKMGRIMAKVLEMEAAKTLKMGDGRGKSEVNGEFLSLVRLRCLLLLSSLIYPLITSTILTTMRPPLLHFTLGTLLSHCF